MDDRDIVSPIRWGLVASAARAVLVPFVCLGLLLLAHGTQGASFLRDWARFSVLMPAGPLEPSPEALRKLQPLVYTVHKVRPKEGNVWAMARAYGTTVPSMQTTNDNELFLISPGMKLMIHNKQGFLYFVKKDVESFDSIVARYHRNPKEARQFKEKVVVLNNLPGSALLGPYQFLKGDYLLLPGVSKSFDNYHFPFRDPGWTRVSSGYGNRFHPILKYRRPHNGVDLPKPYGTPVYPARSGRVTYAGWLEAYGLMVEVRHSDGACTRYGHLSKVEVSVGQLAQQNKTLLGRVGSSGLSTGPHLHFEVRLPNGNPIDPRRKIGRR